MYGALLTIPVGFTGASAYNAATGDWKRARGYAFYAWMGYLSLPLSAVMLVGSPVALLVDGHTYRWGNYVQTLWAQWTAAPFFSTAVFGSPPPTESPAIYVSNHQSWLDVFVLLPLDLGVKFVSKREIFWIPLVGWVMHIIGHVELARGSKRSGSRALESCQRVLDAGHSVFFFAEGTRSRQLNADGVPAVQPFKMGAFKLARDNPAVPIVPISIRGTHDMLPPDCETQLSADVGGISVRFHEPVFVAEDNDLGSVSEGVRRVIVDGLRAGKW